MIPPGGAVQMVTLAADPSRAGSFAGQFQVLQEGAYRLELPVPESQNERLTRRIQVKVPELERENPAAQRRPAAAHCRRRRGGSVFRGHAGAAGQRRQAESHRW